MNLAFNLSWSDSAAVAGGENVRRRWPNLNCKTVAVRRVRRRWHKSLDSGQQNYCPPHRHMVAFISRCLLLLLLLPPPLPPPPPRFLLLLLPGLTVFRLARSFPHLSVHQGYWKFYGLFIDQIMVSLYLNSIRVYFFIY